MDPFELWGEALDPVLAAMLTWVLAIYAVLLVYALVNYIVRSISLFTIAKRRGIGNYGLAWVPVAYLWTLGAIADQYDACHGKRPKWRHVLLWLAVALVVIFVVGYVATIVNLVVRVVDLSQYQQQIPDREILRLLASMYLWIIPVSMVSATQSVCQWICYYKVFESCKPARSVMLLLFSLLLPFALPFCLLSCSKGDLGMPSVIQETAQIPAGAAAAPVENGAAEAVRKTGDDTGNHESGTV